MTAEKDRDSAVPSSNVTFSPKPLLARVYKMSPSVAIVELPDREKAVLPWKELWPEFKIHDDYKCFRVVEKQIDGKQVVEAVKETDTGARGAGRAIAVGDYFRVVRVDTDFGKGKRVVVSHARVDNDPWEDVKDWHDKDIKVFTVEFVTDSWALGTIAPGIRARASLEGLKELLPQDKWPKHQFPLQLDEIAGWFLIEATDREKRIVTLDFVGYIKSQLTLGGLFNLSSPERAAVQTVFAEPSETLSSLFERARINKLLIVDDDEELCYSLRDYLREECNVNALVAFDEQSALNCIAEIGLDIDLAIIDVNLQPDDHGGKDRSGIQVAQKIQEIIPYCPIVLITGEQLGIEDEDIASASDLLLNDIIRKPFGMGNLHETLRAQGEPKKPLKEFFKRSAVNDVDYSRRYEAGIEKALEDLRESLSADAAVLFSIDPTSDEVTIIGLAGCSSKYHANKTQLGWSPIRDAAINQETVFTPNAMERYSYPRHRYLQQAYNYRSCIGVPISGGMASHYAHSLFVFHPDEKRFKEKPDITLVKRVAREIGQLLQIEKLEEDIREMKPFELIGQSYGGLAHDINRYLSGNFLDNAIGKIKSDNSAAAIESIEIARARLSRVSRIVAGLSAMSRGRHEEVTTFPAWEEIEKISDRLKAEIRESKVSLTLSSDLKETPYLKMKPSQLDQLLTNLVINAAQQLERLKKENSVTRNAEVRIEVSQSTDDSRWPWLILQVYDNGPGIHRKDFNRVFDLFYTTKEHGCGMGLDICRKIARDVVVGNLKGEVEVRRSLFLCGSCFETRLPMSV